MEFEELLAPVAGEVDVEDALEDWRWLVTDSYRPLVVTAFGDLFMISADGTVKFLDTITGKCERVASSVPEWEEKLRDAENLDQWFMPGLVEQLRELNVLAQGECYSPIRPPILGGNYAVENWRAINWQVHFSHSGRMHCAIKDLPDGTVITKWSYTEI